MIMIRYVGVMISISRIRICWLSVLTEGCWKRCDVTAAFIDRLLLLPHLFIWNEQNVRFPSASSPYLLCEAVITLHCGHNEIMRHRCKCKNPSNQISSSMVLFWHQTIEWVLFRGATLKSGELNPCSGSLRHWSLTCWAHSRGIW